MWFFIFNTWFSSAKWLCKNWAFALLHWYLQINREIYLHIYFFTFILFTDLQQRFTDQLAFSLWILFWKLPGSWLKPSGLGVPVDTEALQLHQGGVVQSDFQGQLSQINQQVQLRSSLYLWKSQFHILSYPDCCWFPCTTQRGLGSERGQSVRTVRLGCTCSDSSELVLVRKQENWMSGLAPPTNPAKHKQHLSRSSTAWLAAPGHSEQCDRSGK